MPLVFGGKGFVGRGGAVIIVLAALLTAACSESAPPVADAPLSAHTVVAPTYSPVPSSTPAPPSLTPTRTVQPVARVIFNIEVTPTPIPGATFTPTPEPTTTPEPTVQARTPEPVSFAPTSTPFVTFAGTPQATRTPFATPRPPAPTQPLVAPTAPPVVSATVTSVTPVAVQATVRPEPTPVLAVTAVLVVSPVPVEQPPVVEVTRTPPFVSMDKYAEFSGYMLQRINSAREQAGIDLVVLAHNPAAQAHAEELLANCVVSHWSEDGLKPYMRYAHAGGYQENEENAAGANFCVGEGYEPVVNIEVEIDGVMGGWMNSPGHRRNLLDPAHKQVSVGLAWDAFNFFAVQHFEGDYVTFSHGPMISEGVLSISGATRNGVVFASPDDLAVQIYYDQPPHALSRGQLSRTLCYDFGLTVAAVRPPAPVGYEYTDASYEHTYRTCADPYDIPVNVPPPMTVEEGDYIFHELYKGR